MRVSIVGSGYVGLVTGACLAETGHEVVCVDRDELRFVSINAGRAPFFEPGLDELLARHVGKGLVASSDLSDAVRHTELTLIAVGTPFDGSAIDLSAVETVTAAVGQLLRDKSDYHVVVVKSTVVPGTTAGVVAPLLERTSGKRAGADFGVGMNPEFLTEGEAISDFMRPDRIILGALDDAAHAALERLYASFEGVPLVRTNLTTAELVKYASNALLATLVSFSNELADVSTALGDTDIADVMHGLHLSRYLRTDEPGRDGVAPITSFLMAGCGFGGSCLPKDVSALVAHGRSFGLPMELLASVLSVNARRSDEIFRLLSRHFDDLSGVRVAVLGLAFRPDTSDMRESPAIPIIRGLLQRGARVTAYDPAAMSEARAVFAGTDVTFADSLESSLQHASAVVLATRWQEFEHVPALLASADDPPVFVDGRRMLDPSAFEVYEGIGA